MATKKNSFIEVELDWAEEQLASWKAYIDEHPMHELKDRIQLKETRGGGVMPMVIASIEQQGKYIQETMKNYLQLLSEVDKMRKVEAEKVEIRGKGEMSSQAKRFLDSRNK